MNKNPIGIFDSGVGGLTVWNELNKNLPHESFIYLADSENCPYGEKSQDEIINLSKQNTEFLLSKKCKLIIVACNTATAAAIETLREIYPIPFVGMEPAIKPAALNTKTGTIGVLATKGTFKGQLFKETSAKYTNKIDTLAQIGDGLVQLVERNEIDSTEARTLISKYLTPMIEKGADKIVLGCTHYPFFKNIIADIIPSNIEIIDPAPAIASRTIDILKGKQVLNNNRSGKTAFYTNGNKEIIIELVYKLSNTKPFVQSVPTPPYTS